MQRYLFAGGWGPEKEDNGDFVKYEDAQSDIGVLETRVAVLEARDAALQDSVRWLLTYTGAFDENHNDKFERLAEAFYRDTCVLRPGKSQPMGAGLPEDEREAVWTTWVSDHIKAAKALVETGK